MWWRPRPAVAPADLHIETTILTTSGNIAIASAINDLCLHQYDWLCNSICPRACLTYDREDNNKDGSGSSVVAIVNIRRNCPNGFVHGFAAARYRKQP